VQLGTVGGCQLGIGVDPYIFGEDLISHGYVPFTKMEYVSEGTRFGPCIL
jgi:hypothetical protein